MIVNLAIIVIVALLAAALMEKFGLPGLLGMTITGIVLGPYVFDFISKDLLHFSSELRTAALIVILIRAGLGINREVLNKVGKSAVKMSFIPGIFEGVTIIFVAHFLLNIPLVEAGILAFIIAAVSPAVVVPQMLDLKEKGYGKNKEVPTLVLAGASVDDVIAITIFGAFLGSAVGNNENIIKLILNVPISIILGIAIGGILGLVLIAIFKRFHMRDTKKVIGFMIVAILFHAVEELELFPLASLIGIMTIGFVILEKYPVLAKRLAAKFNRVWVLAEVLLFVLIGAQVNIDVVFNSGLLGLLIIAIGLMGRSVGVLIALLNSNLNIKERFFCVIAYLPKATVQAAIGAIPLSRGVASGELILAIAVLSIIVTAPIGAIGIKKSAPYLLER